ncbi:MAG: pyridoxamine 5'-phosphate oxidase family protein [Clostridiales bacterium]|nr:pyridoxamine 5'-phosphate oxidase family protein [Clostridiales bacterium]
MFRQMRRSGQLLPESESIKILMNSTSGVLSLLGDDGYPYGVPLSYSYDDGKLYFHCAKVGHKIDAVKNYDKASFCVIEKDQVVEEEYTSYYRSVIAFGKVHVVEDENEKLRIINHIAAKYVPGREEARKIAINKEFAGMAIIQMDIEHLTGKEARELMEARKRA